MNETATRGRILVGDLNRLAKSAGMSWNEQRSSAAGVWHQLCEHNSFLHFGRLGGRNGKSIGRTVTQPKSTLASPNTDQTYNKPLILEK